MTTYLSWKNKCSRDWRRNCSIFAQKPGRCIYFWGKTHLICYSTFLYKSRMISRREGKTLPMLERVNCWLLLLCLQLQRKDGRRLVYLSQVSEKGLFAPGLCDSLKHLLLQLTRIRLGSPGSSLNPVFDSSLFTYALICSSQPLAHALSHVLSKSFSEANYFFFWFIKSERERQTERGEWKGFRKLFYSIARIQMAAIFFCGLPVQRLQHKSALQTDLLLPREANLSLLDYLGTIFFCFFVFAKQANFHVRQEKT